MAKHTDPQIDRLILRSFMLADALDVGRLAGESEVACTTLNVPHPYEDGMAEQFEGSRTNRKGGKSSTMPLYFGYVVPGSLICQRSII